MSSAPSSLNVLQQVSAQGGAQAGVGSSLDVLNHVAADPTYGMPKYADDEGMTKSADGSFVITPKEGEEFSDTMQRAAAAGKKVSPELVQKQAVKGLKEAPAVAAAAPVIGAAGAAGVATLGEVGQVGARLGQIPEVANVIQKATGAAKTVTTWAQQNPGKALLAFIALKETGVLSKFHELELPLLYLLGGGAASAEGAAGEAAGAEAATATKAAEAAPAAEAEAAAAPKLTPEEFAAQNARNTAQPDALGKDLSPDAATGGKTYKVIDSNGAEHIVSEGEPLNAAQKQAEVDKYFAEHPEEVPKPEVWKRGPKTGQPKTYKVFQNGQWVERQKYK
jgi:hypothetical protein